ncbi:kinase-like protein [Obba rivulosa]|uniref:Kinase-like protein n=1 Tax=Obba rivulosa TaxID=1052685 RepID=A0A8E2DW27_9APHY|nr:kinase-like protein [Obba rivulosa]
MLFAVPFYSVLTLFSNRRYKSQPFAEQLLHILHALRVPSWTNPEITPELLKVYKVSGSLTNDVFFVSCPSVPHTRIVLLRVYGHSSGALISRPRELHTLHVLSSQYQIGPRLYGTFENGRIEEYLESNALTADELRDQTISAWTGARMAELHGVDVMAVEGRLPPVDGEENRWRVVTEQNVESWLSLARDVLQLPAAPEAVRRSLDLDTFEQEWAQYVQWLHEFETVHGPSRRVFSHNDAQYGNLLRLKTLKPGLPEHHQIIVVDFEYAGLNAAAFDIANHFHEWTANYHSSTPHLLNPALYPNEEQRRNFYCAYLKHDTSAVADGTTSELSSLEEAKLQKLEDQVRAWSPASHAMWAVWGVVQAREFLEGSDGEPEFDYLGYAQCRIDAFRRDIRALGTILS